MDAPQLSENHQRKILATLEYSDKLLEESLRMLDSDKTPLFNRYISNLSTTQGRWVQSYIGKIRKQMDTLLYRFQIERKPSHIPVSWALMTNLSSLNIALHEIVPAQMKGYGEIEKSTASDLTWIVQEMQRTVGQLVSFLTEAPKEFEEKLKQCRCELLPDHYIQRLAEILNRHGLVEHLPTLHMIVEKLASPGFEIAFFGRVSSGKSSLINRLLGIDLLPVGSTPITVVPIRIVGSQSPYLQVVLANRSLERMPVERIQEFATEQGNPDNTKHVISLELATTSDYLQNGVAFVDTPGIASLATTGTELSYAYLPKCDFATLLVDSHSTLTKEDLDVLQLLRQNKIPASVLLSKCDLLSEQELSRVLQYTRHIVSERVDPEITIHGISSLPLWEHSREEWLHQVLLPKLQHSKEALQNSLAGKVESLRRSVLAGLEVRYGQKTKQNQSIDPERSESILLTMNKKLQEFRQFWRNSRPPISEWEEKILDVAAARLVSLKNEAGDRPISAQEAVRDAVMEVTAPLAKKFVEDFEALTGQLSQGVQDLLRQWPGMEESASGKLHYLADLPIPQLDALKFGDMRRPYLFSRLHRSLLRNFCRRELEKHAAASVHNILSEYSVRFCQWMQDSQKQLEGSLYSLTDPLGLLRSSSSPLGDPLKTEDFNEDLQFLRDNRISFTPSRQTGEHGQTIGPMEEEKI